MPAPSDHRVALSREAELRRIVPVKQAAEIKGLSEDTFKKYYGHLIRKLSPRRNGVMLGDVIGES